jgi:hypothetical protein
VPSSGVEPDEDKPCNVTVYKAGPSAPGLIVAECTPKQPCCLLSGEPSIAWLSLSRKRDSRDRIQWAMFFMPMVERSAQGF